MTNPAVRQRRFSFTPVDRLLSLTDEAHQARILVAEGRAHYQEDETPTRIAARMLDTSHNSIIRWRRDGVPDLTADKIAARLGLHPIELWDDYLEVDDWTCE